MDLHEEILDEDKEFEEYITKLPPMITKESFVKIPTVIMRNPLYQKWRSTSRASTAEFLFGFVIRASCNNNIAKMLYKKYYVEKHLLVARFTHQGLAERLGFKDRRGINNHMVMLEKEGIFKIHLEPWRNRQIRVYEFGSWHMSPGGNYEEIITMYSKFHKLAAEDNIARLS